MYLSSLFSSSTKTSTSTHTRLDVGHIGEDHVARTLAKNGFAVVARNYTKRCGEIDLICRKGSLLLFIEVKTRTRHTQEFDLSTVITPAKKRRIIKTAQWYLSEQNSNDDCACRFDVALIDTFSSKNMTYIADAFRDETY